MGPLGVIDYHSGVSDLLYVVITVGICAMCCLLKMCMACCCSCLCESEQERTCLWKIHEIYACVFV